MSGKSLVIGCWLLAAGGLCRPARGQTAINLKTQASDIDFTLLSPTKPFQMGASLPGTCVQGSMFFLTGATNGQNLYGCPATNVWALEGGNAVGGGVWGSITGTLSAQADLETALAGLVSLAGSYSAPVWLTAIDWSIVSGAPAVTGLSVVTTLGAPGSNGNVATEAAVRSAIAAASSGVTGPGTTTTGYLAAWGNALGTSLGVGLPTSATPGASTIPQSGAGGLLAAGWLPPPGASTLGGVESEDCSGSGGLVQKINTDGTITCAASGAGATIAVQTGGTLSGAEPTLDFESGAGVVQACVDDPANTRVKCTPSFNTALIPTHDTIHYNEGYCKSTNGTTGYGCSLPDKALLTYQEGETFFLNVDTTCASTCTLSVDGLGAIAIKRADGVTAPGGALIAGRPQPVWFDGAIFRLVNE